ncbi:hypothetical protein FQS96_14430, partial [Enterococcus faecalis]|uniref:Rib/alpha-like domain-containing protein n=1 Tax=Enterococcus faecalis TaxID=1351 RepID=UPI001DDCA355
MERNRKKLSEDQREIKKRYKMYKVKKHWVYAPILFLSVVGGLFVSGEASASAVEQSAIEVTDQVQHTLLLRGESIGDNASPSTVVNTSEEIAATPYTEGELSIDSKAQVENPNQNSENITKDNEGFINSVDTFNQEQEESQKKEIVNAENEEPFDTTLNEELKKSERLEEDALAQDQVIELSNDRTKQVGDDGITADKEIDSQSVRRLGEEQSNEESPSGDLSSEKDIPIESEVKEADSRRKRDNLIKIGFNDSSTIGINNKKNTRGEDGSQQNPYSTDANIILTLDQAKTIDGGVAGGSSKYIAIDIPETYQGAVSFTKGQKVKVTSTNFPNPGDIIPGLNSVVDTAQALINAAGTASTYALDSNINEVVSKLDNLKRLITHTSEVDVPVLGYRVVGNKLEIEISSDGVAKALGGNIDRAVKDLSKAIGDFKFKSDSWIGSAAAATANGVIYIPKKAAESALNGIGGVSNITGKLSNYVGSGNFFGHIKAELPITVNQEKVVENSKGYAVPVEFRGVITNDSPINLVFETNKSNVGKPATIYFKGQKPISSWTPNTQLITVTEGDTPNLYQGITNLPEGFVLVVTDNTTKLNQLKASDQPYNVPVKVTGPGINTDVFLQVKVTPNYQKWVPKVTPIEITKGETPDLPSAITNLPDGAKTEVTTPVDAEKPGEQTGQVTVTFPDGSKKVVDVP